MKSINNLDEIIEISINTELCESYPVDIEIKEDNQVFKCYEAVISYRQITFYSENSCITYDVNNISGENTLLLYEITE